MLGLELPVSAVLDGSARDLLGQEGANALVLTMKNEEGELAWATEQPLAVSLGLGSGEEAERALEEWLSGDVYTVARVCCFRDNTVPYHRNSMALRASYGNWRDELGLRWLNPASQEARAYVAQLCGELAEMGFDEILLECALFPTTESAQRAILDGVDRAEATQDFLAQVEQALSPYGAVLSLHLEGDALTGDSGLTAQRLGQTEWRVWADGQDGVLQEQLAQAGVTAESGRLVETVSDLSPDAGVPQGRLA